MTRLGYVPPPAAAGSSDHGALTGLDDDDHTQYMLAAEVDTAIAAAIVYPRTVFVPSGAQRPIADVGTWAQFPDANCWFQSRLDSASSGINAAVVWDVLVGAGTYKLAMFHMTNADHGIATIQRATITPPDTVGSFTTLGTVDTYSASEGLSPAPAVLTGLTFPAGLSRIKFVALTTNASSVGDRYRLRLNGFSLTRTAA